MPSYAPPKKRQAPRLLLLLFAVFVVIAVVVVATHKSPATTGASDAKPTTSAVGGNSPAAGGKTTTTGLTRPTTTAGAAKSPAASVKTTTGKALGASPTTPVTGPRVLFDIQGAGNDTIGRFLIGTVATPWDVNWSYNCSKLGKKGSFNYTIAFIQGDRPDTNDLGPRQTAIRGSGAEHYHDAGTFGMTVATQCSWTIEISETNP
jgi:hypothetical protein